MSLRSRWISAPLALTIAGTVVLAPATAAQADDGVITFDPPASGTFTYGALWYLPFTTDYRFASGQPVSGEMAGPFDGPIGDVQLYAYYDTARGNLIAPFDQPPTPAGSYQVYLTLRTDYFGNPLVATPSAPASLTIEPAPISIEHKVVVDPNNPVNAIVTASMTGAYIDYTVWSVTALPEELTPSVPRTPGGTWTLRITNGDEVALERQFDQPAGTSPNLSFYWTDVPLNAQLSSTVTFAPTGSSVGNFDVTQSPSFAFTSAPEGRPVPVADPSGTDQDDIVPEEGTSFPLGAVILAGVIGLALVAAIVVLVVRGRRGGVVPSDVEAVDDSVPDDSGPVSETSSSNESGAEPTPLDAPGATP